MIQFEELRLSLLEYEEKLHQLREALGLDDMTKEIEALEAETATDGFWNDLANSQKVQQRISQLKNKVAAYSSLENEYNDALVLIELSDEEEDLDMLDECKAAVDGFAKAFKDALEAEVKNRLKGEPPRKGIGGAAPMTKEQIMAIKDPELRQKKMLENRELFNI